MSVKTSHSVAFKYATGGLLTPFSRPVTNFRHMTDESFFEMLSTAPRPITVGLRRDYFEGGGEAGLLGPYDDNEMENAEDEHGVSFVQSPRAERVLEFGTPTEAAPVLQRPAPKRSPPASEASA